MKLRHHATAIHELMATAAQVIKCEIQAPFFNVIIVSSNLEL